MTNFEKYKDKFLNFIAANFAVVSGEPVSCIKTSCEICEFTGSRKCKEKFLRWLCEETQETDWDKVPVDTKIYVRQRNELEWVPRYFAKYNCGKVFAYIDGCTSFTACEQMAPWDFARLAEEYDSVTDNDVWVVPNHE